MVGEYVALAVLVAAPIGLAFCVRAFFRRLKSGVASPTPAQLVIGNLLVLATLLAAAACVAECWFRWGYDSTDSFGILRTTDRWFQRHYVGNNIGFRDDVDYDLGPPASGVRRVDFVGDSFTAGHGVARVDDRFANLVRAARPGWQVHVFARNGQDTGQELDFVERDLDGLAGGRYACDVVVLVYCLNDVADITPHMQDVIGHALGARERGVFSNASYLVDYLRFLAFVKTEPDVGDYFGSLVASYAGGEWDVQRARLRAFRAAVAAHGGRLVVVTFPFLQNLGSTYAFRDVHAKLAAFWKGEGVPALDLLSIYDGMNSKDLVVGRFDAHPNEKAHAMAAAAIAPFLDRVLRE